MRVGVRDFSLYKRPRNGGRPVYYARFHNDDRSWTAGCSTGQTARSLAEGWATEEVKRRQDEAEHGEPARIDITLAEFAGKDFFSYEGRWALDKRASGKRLSARQCVDKRQTFDKHAIPVLGQKKLRDINRAVLKDFRNDMYQDGYSGSTINRALDCIRAVLEAAEDENRIDAVPRIDRAASRPIERGIPTTDGRPSTVLLLRSRVIEKSSIQPPTTLIVSALQETARHIITTTEVFALRRGVFSPSGD